MAATLLQNRPAEAASTTALSRSISPSPTTCTVAFRGSPANKFLTYRDNGQIKKFAIRDYPGMTYVKGSA